MQEITDITTKAINRYFKALASLGYMSYNDVNKLIVLAFIEELMTGKLSQFITEEDLKIIMNTVYCLSGSNCMIDYPRFTVSDSLIHNYINPV